MGSGGTAICRPPPDKPDDLLTFTHLTAFWQGLSDLSSARRVLPFHALAFALFFEVKWEVVARCPPSCGGELT